MPCWPFKWFCTHDPLEPWASPARPCARPCARPDAPRRTRPPAQASLLSERLNGAGLVQQLELAEGNMFVDPLIWLVTGGLLVAALYPSSRPQAEHGAAYAGAVDVQNLAGRISFLGLATTLATEMITGKGLLALLHVDTGVELSEVEGILAFLVMLILTGPHKHVNPRT